MPEGAPAAGARGAAPPPDDGELFRSSNMAVVRAGMGGVLCLELRVATVMAPGPLPRPGRDWCGAAFFVDLGVAAAACTSTWAQQRLPLSRPGTGHACHSSTAAADAPKRLAHAADGRQADGAHHGELQQPRPPWNEASGRTPIQNPVGRSSSTAKEEHWG